MHGDMPIADRPGTPGAERPRRQIPTGLAGLFIVDSREQHGQSGVDCVAMLQEWRMNSRMTKHLACYAVSRNSNRELTDQIEKAYACAIREPSYSRIAPRGEGFGQPPALPR